MSGRKQHFIPQMILRGFGTATKKSVQVRVHRFDRSPFLTAVDGVGAEREFYSTVSADDSLETLDDQITAYENELAAQLKYLMSLVDGSTADAWVASEFVVHLTTRNDHFRRAMTAAGGSLFEIFAERLSGEESARRLLGISLRKPSKQFKETMKSALDERPELLGLTGLSRGQLEDFLTQHLVQSFSKVHAEMVGPAKTAFDKVATELGQIGADAQRAALLRELVPKLRVQKLTDYKWKVADSKTDLILPDCIGVASARGGTKVPLMLAEESLTEAIYVPLTKRRLLIGSRSDGPTKVDTKYLNRHFARCSWDFFVSDVSSDIPTNLCAQIRKNTSKILDDLISSTFDEVEQ